MRVLEKCGYMREGIMKKSVFKDGELIDSMLYARVAP
jgi:RimJ/RimL family protein N-acetyltransferase